MTIRLTCDVMDTKALLGDIMRHTYAGEQVMFLCEPSLGVRRMQAARVMLSRVRNSLKNKGRKRKYFGLHHSIFPWTEGGKRFDCVVVWAHKNERHQMTEMLEDMLGTGESL